MNTQLFLDGSGSGDLFASNQHKPGPTVEATFPACTDKDWAMWSGDRSFLVMNAVYSSGAERISWWIAAPTDQAAHYWCAVDGECFALRAADPGTTCIANTEVSFELAADGGAVNFH